MLDIKRIRENKQEIEAALKKRGVIGVIDQIIDIDEQRRAIIAKVEVLKARRNEVSKAIPIMKKKGEIVSGLLADMKKVSDNIKAMDAEVSKLIKEQIARMLFIPNTPSKNTPDGKDENDNIELKKYLKPTEFEYTPKPHWDIGEDLDILDFAAAASVTGARFTFYKGLGARLERSLISFMLDTHTIEGPYSEVFPPFMAHRHSMEGTGQLPKFEEDAFRIEGTDYFLIPTAEVPVTNMYRETIISADQLPIYHSAYSACFRAEAGSAGKDTRGLIRQHQFNKVELVKFTKPEDSYAELDKLLADAEKILQKLRLPYRVVELCAGDLGFSAAKTYDIEVWMPSYNRYVEISSCSNFEDYQARRANIKFRRELKAKPEFVHTINGSGLAVGRTTAAILENYQQPDGSVKIPDVLIEYMKTTVIR